MLKFQQDAIILLEIYAGIWLQLQICISQKIGLGFALVQVCKCLSYIFLSYMLFVYTKSKM